jgi:hypothetical protein
VSLFIEWVYEIDLDREIVRIKSGARETSFKLHSIPRQLQWAQEFEVDEDEDEEEGEEEDEEEEEDEDEGELLARTEIGQPFLTLLKPAAPPASLLEIHGSLKITKVRAKTLARPSSQREHVYVIRELLFSHFIETWSRKLSKHILLCRPVDFIYREVVFAILSIASGRFKLVADQSPVWPTSQRRLATRLGSPYGSGILPDFGSGMHAVDVLPGSAPDRSIYWFSGALIVVADDLGDDNALKAAIATVTECGRDSDYRTFDALVINIRCFMLVRVKDSDVVHHTDLIELVGHPTLPQPVRESSDKAESYESFVPVNGNTSSFNILMKFFEVVETYTLGPLKPFGKVLPNELYDKIIEKLDPDTYMKCAEASDAFHHYVKQHIRLWQQPDLATTIPKNGDFSHHVIHAGSSNASGLVVFDSVKGRDVRSSFRPLANEDGGARWAPVIGQDKRQSMLVSCAITDPTLASHSLPIAEESQTEIDDPEFASLYERLGVMGSRLHFFGTKHFYIPKFASVGDVSLAWDRYGRYKLIKSPATGKEIFLSTDPVGHRYLLPRNAGCIPLEPLFGSTPRDANGQRIWEFAGMIWLKKPADFELPLATERALKEAQDYLSREVAGESNHSRPVRHGSLFIVFGAKTQCFRWDIHDNSGEVPPVTTPLENGAVLDIEIEKERDRFEELFGRFRDEVEAARMMANSAQAGEEDAVTSSMGGAAADADAGTIYAGDEDLD